MSDWSIIGANVNASMQDAFGEPVVYPPVQGGFSVGDPLTITAIRHVRERAESGAAASAEEISVNPAELPNFPQPGDWATAGERSSIQKHKGVALTTGFLDSANCKAYRAGFKRASTILLQDRPRRALLNRIASKTGRTSCAATGSGRLNVAAPYAAGWGSKLLATGVWDCSCADRPRSGSNREVPMPTLFRYTLKP